MKKLLIRSILGICALFLLVTSCKKAEVTPTQSTTSGANYSWNGTNYQTSTNGSSTGGTISEKFCNYYVIFSYVSTTQGSSTVANYIYLYLPSNVSTGTYNVQNFVGTSSGTALSGNSAWLLVYSLSTSGSNVTYNYGYATAGKIDIKKTGDAITATFSNLDTYSEAYSNSQGAISTGKLSGSVATTGLTYDLSAYDCNATTSGNNNGNGDGNNTTTGNNTVSGGNTDENPLLGNLTFNGVNYHIHKDDYGYFSSNGTGVAAASYIKEISGANTLTGSFQLTFKSAGSTITAGDYPIAAYGSASTAGTSTFYGFVSDQSSNYIYGYGTSGKITVSLANGKTTITWVDVQMNSKDDGTGDDLGKVSGTVTQ